MYKITIKPSAIKEMSKLPAKTKERVIKIIENIKAEPRPAGVRKLVGKEGAYRIRTGEYRVVYLINDTVKIVKIIAVKKRSEAYK